MQLDFFAPAAPAEPVSPLHGIRIKVEARKHCCDDVAIVHPRQGPRAYELRCVKCDAHRGWLPKQAASFLLETLKHFPDANKQLHTIRMGSCNGNS
jgi:hypothetical protein